jgi:homoserine O-acetyltransferase/O-succinyltransferase
MLVKEIMKKPFFIEKDITLEDAANIMVKQKISSILFVKSGKVAGIVTHEDLVDNFGRKAMVSEVLSKNLIFIRDNDKIQNAAELIREKKISILPVLDKSGNLVGVVHVKDILKEFGEDEFLLD